MTVCKFFSLLALGFLDIPKIFFKLPLKSLYNLIKGRISGAYSTQRYQEFNFSTKSWQEKCKATAASCY